MYRAAVIGCGRIGASFSDDPLRAKESTHCGAYVAYPDTELVAVCDLDEEKAAHAADKFGALAYTKGHMMIGKHLPEIVSVCTPPETHKEQVLNLAECSAVKAIFCEKPIATTLKDAREMIDVCRRHNVLLAIGHQRRFTPLYRQAAGAIRDGGLGSIQHVVCHYTAGVMNTGTHLFDLLRMFFGDANMVDTNYTDGPFLSSEDPCIDGRICFDSAAVDVYACDVNAYAIFEIDILGMEGRLVFSNDRLSYWSAEPSEHFSGYKELVDKSHLGFAGWIHTGEPALLYAMRNITGTLDGNEELMSTGKDGLRALELVLAFKRSAREGEVCLL